MRRIVIVLAIILLSAGPCLAFSSAIRAVVSGTYTTAGCDDTTGITLAEDFEGTGAPAGWSSSGTVDWDYATTPLRGCRSLQVSASSYAYVTASGSTVWVHFEIRPDAVANYQPIFYIVDGSMTWLVFLKISDGYLQLYNGDINALSSTTITAGTKYHIWIRYTAGTGTNGIATMYWGTSKTRPASADISITTGTSTANASYAVWNSAAGASNVVDQVRIDESSIGDVCD